MKYYILLVALCVSCLMATGEGFKDQLKDAGKLVKMTAVRDCTDKKSSGEYEVLKIEFSSKQEGLGDIYVRVAVEVTDKEKNTHLIEEMRKFPDDFDDKYVGEGYWELEIPYGSFDKLKISAYAVEFALKDGEEFVPFDADYDDVKTYEELTARTTKSFPNECTLGRTIRVNN